MLPRAFRIASSMARSARLTKTVRRISRPCRPRCRKVRRAISSTSPFDLLYDGGEDLRSHPLVERKAPLQTLLSDAGNDPRIHYVEHLETGGDAVLRSACKLSLEGIVSKQADAPYQSGRTEIWAKSKCWSCPQKTGHAQA